MINEHLWEFPHHTVIKVMGDANQPLDITLLNILIDLHIEHDKHSLCIRPSKKGNYRSVSCKVTFINKEQVEAFYHTLNNTPEIKLFL